MDDTDPDQVLDAARKLRMSWIQHYVRWASHNPAPGEYDWGSLDRAVEAATRHNTNLMLTIYDMLAWARPNTDQNGPPSDYQTFAIFLSHMALRYQGRVQACQIWNGQNSLYIWGGRGHKINAVEYVSLLHAAGTGTAHGLYEGEPIINVERVSEIVAAQPIPLVLHRGTGLSDEVFKELIARGETKVNISTQLKIVMADSYRSYLNARRDLGCGGWPRRPWTWAGSWACAPHRPESRCRPS